MGKITALRLHRTVWSLCVAIQKHEVERMGNYEQLEPEFIQRTLALMEQYDRFIDIENIDFSNQYNYTLTINCFLGIIVMPKERVIKQIPDSKLDGRLKEELGIVNTEISSRINNLRQLIHQLRNSVAHFNIEVESSDEQFLFDYLVFKDHDGNIVARFPSGELVPFLRSCVLTHIYYLVKLLLNKTHINSFHQTARGSVALLTDRTRSRW